MGKQRRRRKCIGRRFKHCSRGLLSRKKQRYEPSYDACSQVVSCDGIGDFKDCNCVVHHVLDDDHFVEVNDDTDEYWLVIGSTIIKLESEDDIDRVTYQQLRMDCEKNEKLLCSIGFEVLKTTNHLTLIQLYEKRFFSTKMAITIDTEFNLFVTVHNKCLSKDHPIFARTRSICIFKDLVIFLKEFEKFIVCIGNSDIPNNILRGNVYVEHDHGAVYSQTIRSNHCTLLTDRTNRCTFCSKYRCVLQRANRKKTSTVSLSSQRTNASMTKEDLIKKTKMLKKKYESAEGKNKRLLLKKEFDRKDKNSEITEDNNGDHRTCT